MRTFAAPADRQAWWTARTAFRCERLGVAPLLASGHLRPMLRHRSSEGLFRYPPLAAHCDGGNRGLVRDRRCPAVSQKLFFSPDVVQPRACTGHFFVDITWTRLPPGRSVWRACVGSIVCAHASGRGAARASPPENEADRRESQRSTCVRAVLMHLLPYLFTTCCRANHSQKKWVVASECSHERDLCGEPRGRAAAPLPSPTTATTNRR